MSKNPPVVLLCFASARADRAYLRNVPEEHRRVRAVLSGAEQAGLCEIVERADATLDDLLDVFQTRRDEIAVFHFAGHADGWSLLLEDSLGRPEPVAAGGLARFLAHQRGLRAVFLNACATRAQVEGLITAGVPVVVSTSDEIDDSAAADFAERFYRALATGASIGVSFDEASAALDAAHPAGAQRVYRRRARNQWPWSLDHAPGARLVAEWNLPDATGQPLFGLPEPPRCALPASPFRHLRRYRAQHAELFFGRGHEIRGLYERLLRPAGEPVLLLYGASGVGKSSLLEAGLIPRLDSEREVILRRRDPATSLSALVEECLAIPDGGVRTWRALEQASGRARIVVIDQVEEAITQPRTGASGERIERSEIVDMAATLALLLPSAEAWPLNERIVLSFRKDYLPEIEDALVAARVPFSRIFIDRLDRDGVVEAIVGPTRSERLIERYGLEVEDELPETIAGDLLRSADSSIAPILQVVLSKLWSRALARNADAPLFDAELYQQVASEGLGLSDFLDRQLDRLDRPGPLDQLGQSTRRRSQEAATGLVLAVLRFHTTPHGTAKSRTMAELEAAFGHCSEDLPGLLAELDTLRLLLPIADEQADEGRRRTVLAHDTLAPWVRRRFDESDRPGQRARRILDSRLPRSGDIEPIPLDEADLATVEAGIEGMTALDERELALVRASREWRAMFQRSRRRRELTLVVSAVLIVLSAAFAWWQSIQHRIERDRAQSRALAAAAIDALERPPPEALSLAIEATRTMPTVQAEAALRQALLEPRLLASRPRSIGAFDSSGERIISLDSSGALAMLDGRTLEPHWVQTFDRRGSDAQLGFSPNGSSVWWFESQAGVQSLRVFDSVSGAERFAIETPMLRFAFTLQAERLVLIEPRTQGEIAISWRNARTGEVETPPRSHLPLGPGGGVAMVAVAQNGRYLVRRARRDLVSVVDLLDPAQFVDWKKDPQEFSADVVAISPDSRFAAWAGLSGRGLLVEVFDGAGKLNLEPRQELVHRAGINQLRFSRSSDYLGTAGADGATTIIGLMGDRPFLQTVDAGIENLSSLAFAPSDEWMIVTSTTGSARRVRTFDGALLGKFVGSGRDVSISADEERILTFDIGGEGLKLWSRDEGWEDSETDLPFLWPDSAAFSADRGRLIVGNALGPRLLTSLNGTGAECDLGDIELRSAAFLPGGESLVAAPWRDLPAFRLDVEGCRRTVLRDDLGRLSELVASPTEQVVVGVQLGGDAELIDARTGARLGTTEGDDSLGEALIEQVVFSPTGEVVFLGSANLLSFRDATTFEEIARWSSEGEIGQPVASADGRHVAVVRDRAELTILTVPDARVAYEGSYESLDLLGWNPASGLLLVLSNGSTVWIDPKRQRETPALPRWDSRPVEVEIRNDGRYLLRKGPGRDVRLWDLENQELRATFQGVDPIRAVFSEDGKKILVVDHDGTLSTYLVEVPDLIELACSRLPRGHPYRSLQTD